MRKLLAFVFVCSILYSKSQSICGGSSILLTAPNPSNLAGPSYSMNPGGITTNSTAGFNVSPNVTTSYTLYTTGTNTNNATQTTTFVTTVTVNPQPSANPSFTQAGCTNTVNQVNLNLTFNPSNPTPAYTLSWTPLPASVLAPTQTTASGLTPGPYTVIVTPAGGCTIAINFIMTPAPAPAVFSVTPFGGPVYSITCIQDTVTLGTTNTNLSYTWSSTSFTPRVAQTITLSAANVGSIVVTGITPTTSANLPQCTLSYTINLVTNTVAPTITITPLLQNITCSQTAAVTVTLTGNPKVNVTHYVYAPTSGAVFSSSADSTIYTIGGPGLYIDTLKNDLSGCFVVKIFTVTSGSGFPTYSVTSPQNFTLGCTTKSVATINIVGAVTTPTQGGPVSYTVLGPTTTTNLAAGTLSTGSTYTINVPGTYTVIVRDNTNFCDRRTAISILSNTFLPNVSAIVPRQILDCDNPTTTLQAVSLSPGVSYNWGFVGVPGNVPGGTITVNTIPVTPNATLINTYTLTVTEINNTCKSTSIIAVYQNLFRPNTAIAGLNAISCAVQTLVLTNNSSTGIKGTFFPAFLPVIGYLWEGPDPQEPLQVSSIYNAQTPGTYTLTGKDLNNGCTSTATFAVADNKIFPILNSPLNPTVSIPAYLDCGASSVDLFVTINNSTSNGYTFKWTPPTSATVSVDNINPYKAGLPGIYTVVVTNPGSGCAKSTTMQVSTGTLTAMLESDIDKGYAPLLVTFFNKSASSNTVSATANIKATWSFGNGVAITTTASADSPVITYNAAGTYTVRMFSTKGVCLDTAYKVITVEIPSSLEVPNVFTPNGDGTNDLFFLKGTNLSEIEITIYDRWGHLVYELRSSTGNVSWDGKNQLGTDCAEGVYYYVLKASGKDGTDYPQKGTISLIR